MGLRECACNGYECKDIFHLDWGAAAAKKLHHENQYDGLQCQPHGWLPAAAGKAGV